MEWNRHSEIEGRHALLGASKYAWLNYDDEQFAQLWAKSYLAEIGTLTHDFARKHIKYRSKLKQAHKSEYLLSLLDSGIPPRVLDILDMDGIFATLSNYINDAISFRLDPEIPLKYSSNSFGTADAIGYHNKTLRIHDLKTGIRPAKFEQLEIYAALFWLEYGVRQSLGKLDDITIELRIYQSQEVMIETPEPDLIMFRVNQIKQRSHDVNVLLGLEE